MGSQAKQKEQIVALWSPQPRQRLALTNPAEELFYGGAAGGGKSDWLLMDFYKLVEEHGSHHRGVVFRRSFPELEELILRSRELYYPLGGEYSETRKVWTFPSGATLKFRFIERDSEVHNYQGHQYTWIGWDELTNWPTDYPYVYLMSRLRSPHGVPCRVRAAGNPGGAGHSWVKRRFIDPSPAETIFYDGESETTRCFIPAKLEDNLKLMEKDPGYEKRMKQLPPHLYRALREGDWTVFAGQVFEEFREETHVVKPFALDPSWYKFCSMDWGYAKPFSIGWWAVTGDGRMIRYREWYGCAPDKPDTGVRMQPTEVAERAMEMSVGEGVTTMVADPAIWNNQGVENTIADLFAAAGWTMEKAINDRISGKMRFHDMLQLRGMDGRPMMLIFNTCRSFIRTIPMLVYDEKKVEDVDTTGEDHVYDEARYGLMSPHSRRSAAPADLEADDFNVPVDTGASYDPLNY